MTVELLVIHSDPAERRRIREIASDYGLRMCESDHAVAGILLAREASPAMVVLDLEPRGMDGLFALGMLSAESNEPVPVLAVGARDARARERAKEAGASEAVGDLGDGSALRAFLERHRPRIRRRRTDAVASLP
jgi:DNA-binding response OmpR family regulator